MLSFADFSPVSMRDGDFLYEKILPSGVKSCEFSFANLAMWQASYDIRYAQYRHHLYVAELDDDGTERGLLFLPCPGDEPDPAELREVADALRPDGFSGNFYCVAPDYLARHADCENFFSVCPMGDAADEYFYETEKLATLPGEKLSKKRNLIAQFLRDHPDARAVPVTSAMTKQCIGTAEAWHAEHPDKDPDEVRREKTALETMLGNFGALRLAGVAVFIGEKMIAFALCSPLCCGIYDEHYEKSLLAYKGAAQFVNRETAKLLLPYAKYLNREQDMGIAGLRQAKLSYRPCEVLNLFSLSPR